MTQDHAGPVLDRSDMVSVYGPLVIATSMDQCFARNIAALCETATVCYGTPYRIV